MYRFLRNASSTAHSVSFPRLGAPQTLTYCTLCNNGNSFLSGFTFPSHFAFRRNLNTEELMRLQNSFKKGKKYRKFKKKFTELLEVKEDSSNVTKAAVRNLSPKDISKLTEKPEISLENLHLSLKKSKAPPPSQVTPNPIANCDDLFNQANLSPVNDEDWENKSEAEIELDLIGRNTESIDMFSDVTYESLPAPCLSSLPEPKSGSLENQKRGKKKSSKKVSSTKSEELATKKKVKALEKSLEEEQLKLTEQLNKNRMVQAYLNSYIEACVHCDFLTLAYNTIYRYLNKHKFSDNGCINSVEPFNKLIHGFARKGNIDKVMEVLRMIVSCNISFDLQTFVGCFECLSGLPDSADNEEKREMILKQFSLFDFTFQDLLTKGIFVRDQREKVLSFIHTIDPSFVPHYEFPVQDYACPLLQHVNDHGNRWRSPAETVVTSEELMKFSHDQMQIELQPFQKIDSVTKPKNLNGEIRFFRRKWNKLENEWKNVMRAAFEKNLKNLELQLNNTKLFYSVNIYPYFRLLDADEYVDIMLTEIEKLLRGSETFSACLRHLHVDIGKQVRLRYDIKRLQDSQVIDKINDIYSEYCKWYLNPENNPDARNTRMQWQKLSHERVGIGPTLDDTSSPWSNDLLRNIGKFLYDIIINELEVDVNMLSSDAKTSLCTVSAFNELPRTHGKFIREEIKPHPLVGKIYRKACLDDLCFNIELLPTVSPPVPWVSLNQGGYLVRRAEFVRLYDAMANALPTAENKQLLPVFDSLNQLSAVPWRINTSILDLMIKIFVDGGSEKLNIPKPSSSLDIKSLIHVSGKKASKPSYTQQLYITRKKGEMHGLWCEALYRLSLANHYRDRVIWLPHNMDFRGRVYPVPPHLTHIGSDMARALLGFAKGEKLGPRGLDWLKIHCINLTGLKKRCSTAERLQYANEILPDILDSAQNPLTGKMWWAESEDMWQTLACCMEIKNAIDSGDPENFVCHFPVHQDGSCNGLQHYAALGRDVAGGMSVNLLPSPVPQDVYSCVVAMVEKERAKDAANGSMIAVSLDGVIQRKIIKQTIMTTVYGVTRFGARLQIAKQLKDVENFPTHLVWGGSMYLVSKTFLCLREMFCSARQIQDWFTDCARTICSTSNKCVEWETPLGLPVIQPYVKTKSITKDGNRAIYQSRPNGIKQKNAFPPNFIHSLDSSHMMLTSIMCERQGITFVSVHDCFWTHPSSIEVMGKICREQFVALHSEPILENLSDFFLKKYAGEFCINGGFELPAESPFEIFQKVPDRGDMVLKDILRSEYFFS